jgi:hypothetical protein
VASAHYPGRTVLWSGQWVTFKTEDNVERELAVIFNTAGAQMLTVTDSLNPARQGSTTVVVVRPAWARLRLEAPARSEPGKAFMATVTVLDESDKPFPDYDGLVHFTATDPLAELPADFTFRPTEFGVHSFPVTFKTIGNHILSVGAVARPAVVGSTTVRILEAGKKEPTMVVTPGPLTHFRISAPPASKAGQSIPVTILARDAFENQVSDYRGTVRLTSSDPKVVLPADHQFVEADNGGHRLPVTLRTPGEQTITVTDVTNGAILGKTTVLVAP